jgi:polysaccharide biosynthesis protein PslH
VIELDRYPASAPNGDSFNVIFPAAFGFPPNAFAARRLLYEIFPELSARARNARLSLVGREPSSDLVAAAQGSEQIQVTGAVHDMIPYLREASAMAVPLNEGTGTRFKILEAFASGIPVVSTAKGIEGIAAVPDEHYLAAESDAEFVDALARLASDRSLGDGLAARALELVGARYSWASAREIVTRALAAETVR